MLNHVSSPARVAEFVAAARAAGATLPFVAAVAVYTDERSARVLQRFPGLHLDDAAVERVLAAPDPRRGRDRGRGRRGAGAARGPGRRRA